MGNNPCCTEASSTAPSGDRTMTCGLGDANIVSGVRWRSGRIRGTTSTPDSTMWVPDGDRRRQVLTERTREGRETNLVRARLVRRRQISRCHAAGQNRPSGRPGIDRADVRVPVPIRLAARDPAAHAAKVHRDALLHHRVGVVRPRGRRQDRAHEQREREQGEQGRVRR